MLGRGRGRDTSPKKGSIRLEVTSYINTQKKTRIQENAPFAHKNFKLFMGKNPLPPSTPLGYTSYGCICYMFNTTLEFKIKK